MKDNLYQAIKEHKCPACKGSGQVQPHDPLPQLIAVYLQLSQPDQREVIIYAQYLKQSKNGKTAPPRHPE